MRLTDRIAGLHPALVTTAFVLAFVGAGLALSLTNLGGWQWSIVYASVMAATIFPVLLWHYSIYRAASDRSAAFVRHSGRRAFLFITCGVAMALFLASFPLSLTLIPASPTYRLLASAMYVAMPIACFTYFAAIWAAANALTRFDEHSKSVEVHKTLGTFILEFYFPIGIWVIYPRIKRMLTTPLPV